MRGHTHALSGIAAGAAAGLYALHLPAAGTVTLACLAGAAATLPDLDQRCSSAGRSLGPLSDLAARVIRAASGGHRHGTHSIIGIAVFTLLAILAAAFRRDPAGLAGLALLLALAIAAGLRALAVHHHLADAVALAAAAAIAWTGWQLALVPAAIAIGCAAHIAGDMLTTEGCPLAWPVTLRHSWLAPRLLRIETGHWAEHVIVAPALVAAIVLLAWHAVTIPGFLL